MSLKASSSAQPKALEILNFEDKNFCCCIISCYDIGSKENNMCQRSIAGDEIVRHYRFVPLRLPPRSEGTGRAEGRQSRFFFRGDFQVEVPDIEICEIIKQAWWWRVGVLRRFSCLSGSEV